MSRGIVFTARGRGGHNLQRGSGTLFELEGGGTVFKPSVARGYLQSYMFLARYLINKIYIYVILLNVDEI
jgi:hypothetical protein